MRKKNREVTDLNELTLILSKCQVCHIAFFDEEYPYIIPMNFGFEVKDHNYELYFHCAKEGKKLLLAAKNPKVAFEMDCGHNLLLGATDCASSMEFESICGNGTFELLEGKDKIHGLTQIMKQFVKKDSYDFEEKELEFTNVFKIRVNEICGKRLKKS